MNVSRLFFVSTYLVLCNGSHSCRPVGFDAAHPLILPHLQILVQSRAPSEMAGGKLSA